MLYGSGNDADRVLFLARLPVLILFVTLAFLAAWAAWRMSGSAFAAVTAYALTAFCPNLIAHGRLATNDLELTFFLMAAALLLLEWSRTPSLRSTAIASVAVAAALLMKISALILVPWLLIILWPRRREWRLYAARACVLFLFVAVEMELFYAALMRSFSLVAPFREFTATFAIVGSFVRQGFQKPQYLLGTFSTTGWWYYYPVAFLLKTTIPALVLILLAVAAAVFLRRPPGAMVLFIALFAAASIASSLALGLRYVLPIYPFVYVSAACTIAKTAEKRREKNVWISAVLLLLVWHAGESVATYPNYIGYFSELIGSRDNADLYLIDSNLDWGQDLKRLAHWVDDQHISSVNIDYFGGGDIHYYLGDRAVPLDGPDPRRHRPGYFAVSKHFYRASFFYRQYGLDYGQYFAGATKVATINGSIDVWRIR
jgi:4-amino-4-deoxy-L-arabinose transferase-like glycosyltransferase